MDSVFRPVRLLSLLLLPLLLHSCLWLVLGEEAAARKLKKSASKKATPIKLKPKQQWDRYSEFKREDKVPVAIRLTDTSSTSSSSSPPDWLEVGRIKSKDNQYTQAAVALQRAIIAEHGKRLYPLQVSKKMNCEWGYLDSDNDTWTVVNVKDVMSSTATVDGLEKQIGFEGTPDPATGFYCVYDNGKLRLGEETSFT